jgi:hypothetical protein
MRVVFHSDSFLDDVTGETCNQGVLRFPMLSRASRLVQARASAPAVRLGAVRMASTFMTNYKKEVAERAAMGIVPKPLDAAKTAALVELLQKPPADEGKELLELLKMRVPPGVDEAAYVKAGFLAAVAKGDAKSPLISQKDAVFLLGTMQGGYNIQPLVDALDKPDLAEIAADALSKNPLEHWTQAYLRFTSLEGGQKIRDAMQSIMNTTGVVAALVSTLVVSALVSPPVCTADLKSFSAACENSYARLAV